MLLFLGSPAQGMITHDSSANHSSEASLKEMLISLGFRKVFPYWKNVGQIERSTGIYLGNGFVLTAAHVGAGAFRTSDGRSYSSDSSDVHYFKNYDGSQADLCLFRIRFQSQDPIASFPAIPLTTALPVQGTPQVLLGAGAGGKERGKRFAWNDDYHVRWGINVIEEIYSVPMPTSQYSSFGFATKFERHSMDSQAAPGDSGGGVFFFNESKKRWELSGVIVAVDSRFGGADFGNQTYIADPALFRQRLAISKGVRAALIPTSAP
ncbi:MAG: trypsin-like peptidase domain-containing protein [Verrucomicrobiota bacterium]